MPPAPAATASEPGWLLELGSALLVFLIWRGLLALVVLFGGAMTQERPDRDPNTRLWQAFPDSYFWDGWARWDSGWFMTIVEEGYAAGENARRKAAFFPLYPYATRELARLTGNHWVAGLLISNAALFGALVFLGRIARDSGLDEDGASRAQVYLLAYPTSFFLSAYYSEGLFLFLTTASMSAYLRGRYVSCGLAGALACFTRHIGLALFVACLLGYLWSLRRPGVRFRPSALGLLLIPLGTLGFMAILFAQLGDPLAFLSAHGAWGRSAALPHDTLAQTLSRIDWRLPRDVMNTIDLMDALSAILFLILPLFLFRRADPALPIFSLLLILVPLASGSVKSMLRCECVAFPVFLTLAEFGRNRVVDRALVFGSALLLGVLVLQFANWYWVG
jgi:hypothetical protein